MAQINVRINMQDIVNEMAAELIRHRLSDCLKPLLMRMRRTRPTKRKRHGIAKHTKFVRYWRNEK